MSKRLTGTDRRGHCKDLTLSESFTGFAMKADMAFGLSSEISPNVGGGCWKVIESWGLSLSQWINSCMSS